jgi:DNA end-binding protein Ku
VPGIGPVDRDKIVKGYEVSKGHYVLLDPEEIEKVRLESKKTLDLVEFVDVGDIDAMYYEKPYYVVPADDLAEEAFVVLRDALRQAKKIGVGQLAMRGQEYVVALKPCGKGILLETLRYADEVHKANSYFREIGEHKPDKDMLDLASMLIEKKTGKFDASEFHNRYIDALKELIAEKQRAKGEKIIQDPDADKPPPKGSNVIDLMAALKKSLESGGGGASAEPKAKPKVAARSAARPKSRTAAKKAPARKRA